MAGPIDVWVPTHSMMGQQEHPPNLAGDCVAPGDAHTNTPFMPTFTLFGAPSNELTADPEFVPPPSAVDGLGGSKRLGSRQHSQHPATIPQESEAEDTQADALAAWVASIIANNGGVITSASLGSTLSSEHQSLYRVIKVRILKRRDSCSQNLPFYMLSLSHDPLVPDAYFLRTDAYVFKRNYTTLTILPIISAVIPS